MDSKKLFFVLFALLLLSPMIFSYSINQHSNYRCDGHYHKVQYNASGKIFKRIRCTRGCSDGVCLQNKCWPQQISKVFCENNNKVAWFVKCNCREYKRIIRKNDPICIYIRKKQTIQKKPIWKLYGKFCTGQNSRGYIEVYKSSGREPLKKDRLCAWNEVCVQKPNREIACEPKSRKIRPSTPTTKGLNYLPAIPGREIWYGTNEWFCKNDYANYKFHKYETKQGNSKLVEFPCSRGKICKSFGYGKAKCVPDIKVRIYIRGRFNPFFFWRRR